MENRIKRLESVIVAAGLQGQSNRESPPETNNAALPDSTNVTDRLSSLVIDEEGNSNFLGELDKNATLGKKAESHRHKAPHLASLYSPLKDFSGSRKELEVLNCHSLLKKLQRLTNPPMEE